MKRQVFSSLMLLSVIGISSNAFAKAESCPRGYLVTAHAIVTQIDSTDNLGDTDYNFFLRPVPKGPDGKPLNDAFPGVAKSDLLNLHWPAFLDRCRNDWIDDVMMPVLRGTAPKNRHNPTMNSVAPLRHIQAHEFSAECRADSGEELGCPNLRAGEGFDVAGVPCPKFLSSPACINDLHRLGVSDPHKKMPPDRDLPHNTFALDHLSLFTTKAEVFLRTNSFCSLPFFSPRCNQTNSVLTSAMGKLGVRAQSEAYHADGGAAEFWEDAWVHCREFDFNPSTGRYVQSAHKNGPCGKQVLIQGVITYDDKHGYRPELHPISKMIIAEGNGRFRVGTFIDGSNTKDAVSVSSTDYRSLFGPRLMPENIEIDLAALRGPRPSHLHNPVAECRLNDPNAFSHNLKRAPSVTNSCTTATVQMDFSKDSGSAWVGEVYAGWREDSFSFSMNAQLDTPNGVIARVPPSQFNASSSCYVDNSSGNSDLKRWYRYRINRSLTSSSSEPVTASYSKSHPDITFTPQPNPVVPRGTSQQYVWLPASQTGYQGSITATIREGSNQRDSRTVHLNASRPTAALTQGQVVKTAGSPWTYTVQPNVGGKVHHSGRLLGLGGPSTYEKAKEMFGPNIQMNYDPAFQVNKVYTIPDHWLSAVVSHMPVAGVTPGSAQSYSTTITASGQGFCGSNLQYVWSSNGQSINFSGPGPHNVTLGADESRVYTVSVRDTAGVEQSTATMVVRSSGPRFVVADDDLYYQSQSTSRAVSLETVPPRPALLNIPFAELSSAPNSVPRMNHKLCPSVRLVPNLQDYFKFDELKQGLTYSWSDMKYASPSTNGQYQSIPSDWLKLGENNRTYELTPKNNQLITYQASVEVRSKNNKKYVVHLRGSNDCTPLNDLSSMLAQLKRAVPSRSVGYSLHGIASSVGNRDNFASDPISHHIDAFIHRIEMLKRKPNIKSMDNLRSEIRWFIPTVVSKTVGRTFNIRTLRLTAPSFSTRASRSR